MLVSGHLRDCELRRVVLPQRGEHTRLQRVVVGDDVPHIWRDRRGSDHARKGRTSEPKLACIFTVKHVIDLAWGRLEEELGGCLDAFRGVHVESDREVEGKNESTSECCIEPVQWRPVFSMHARLALLGLAQALARTSSRIQISSTSSTSMVHLPMLVPKACPSLNVPTLRREKKGIF